MVPLEQVPSELREPGRAIPPWAPGITYLVTMALLCTLFIAGPGIGAILLGVKADVPGSMRAGAIAVGVVLILLVPFFISFAVRRRRVYKNGTLVATTIERRKERLVKSGKIRTKVYIYEFTFPGPSGTLHGKTQFDSLGQRKLGFLPEPGDTVFVVYNPAKPKRCYAWSYARDGQKVWAPGMKR